MPQPYQLILTSQSYERRQQILSLGLRLDGQVNPNIDERRLAKETPRQWVMRLAQAKLCQGASLWQQGHSFDPALPIRYIGGDTMVIVGNRQLDKPNSPEEARHYLEILGGRRHLVWGSVAVMDEQGQIKVRVGKTIVRFRRLLARDIETYIETGDWQGRAGGYSLQGQAAKFIDFISGSPSLVMGFDLCHVQRLLSP